MGNINWQTCGRCDGSGEVEGLIEMHPCPKCAGTGRTPEDTPQPGASAAFYKPGPGNRQRIALLHASTDEDADARPWRVTHFAKNGPCGHCTRPASSIMEELRGYRYAPGAARLLDYWASLPQWQRGLQQIEFITYANLFSFNGCSHLAHRLHEEAAAHGLPAALTLAERLRRQHLPDSTLF